MDRAASSCRNVRHSGIGFRAAATGPIHAAGYFRWVICALLLFGTTKNYMDRQVLGMLKTTLQHDLGWNEIDYGNLVFAFQAAYAVGMVVVGRLIDRLGTRLGYALAMVFWSLASMGHALGSSFTSFIVARSALGFGESGVFPASIKTVAEWFPKKERALATGIFNAGTNVGAIITPLVVPWITIHWGWRWAFIITGALGFRLARYFGCCSIASPMSIRASPRRSWTTSAAIPSRRWRKSNGLASYPIARPGRSWWASS